MLWLFLKVSLLIAIVCIFTNESTFTVEKAGNQDESYNQNDDRLNLNVRMSKLEAENRQQKQEMAVMKATINENRKEMENMNGRVSTLEKSENHQSDNIDVLSRSKRPYRLIPVKLPIR